MEPGERMLIRCVGGPSTSRLVRFPPPLEVEERDGTYVLDDDGPVELWRYVFVPRTVSAHPGVTTVTRIGRNGARYHGEVTDGGDATPHPWQDWVWDDSVFQGTSDYYRRGRKPYAPGLADELARALELDGQGRLLDVGCGPGTVTVLFAHLFSEVVGLDPDVGMIAQARRAAAEARIANASWVQMRAEALPGALGTFRVVTFAQSFHWMDRPEVAAAVRAMLEPGGVVVQVDLWHRPPPELHRPGPYPAVPDPAIDELRVRWLGPDLRAGQGRRNSSPDDEDAIFQAAGFAPEQTVIVPDDRMLERDADDVVAWVLSTSSTAPHLFGDRLVDFERELRAVLAEASPEGRFSDALSENRLRLRRPT